MGRLRTLGPDLWCVEDELRTGWGARFPVRTTIARDEGGGLILWSPIAIDDELAAELATLGAVRWLVAPNLFHHLYLAAAVARYPEARLVGVAELARKRPDLPWASPALDEAPPFGPGVEIFAIDGAPKVREMVLFHRASRSLVVTDLVFAILEPTGWADRVVFGWIAGTLGRVGQSRLWRWSLTTDRVAAGASLRRLLDLPFDQLVMAHGTVVERGGAAALEQACAWMLAGTPALLPSAG